MGSGVLLTPLLFWGSCIVVGLKGADTAKDMCREGSAPIPGSPESMKLCREEPPRISPVPFKPGLPLGVSKLGDAKPCPGSLQGQNQFREKDALSWAAQGSYSLSEHPLPSWLHPHHPAQAPTQPHSLSTAGFGPSWEKTAHSNPPPAGANTSCKGQPRYQVLTTPFEDANAVNTNSAARKELYFPPEEDICLPISLFLENNSSINNLPLL